MMAHEYPCGNLECDNKGNRGPRVAHLCPLCNQYFRTAIVGWRRRKAFNVSVREQGRPANASAWDKAYAAVDGLNAMAEGNHATYMFFRALHFITCSQLGRTYGATVRHFNGLLDDLASLTVDTVYLESEWAKVRKCRQWCGRRNPEKDCENSCKLAASYLLEVKRISGQAGLDRAAEIVAAFASMSGVTRCKAYNVADDILGLDPLSCVGLGQYTRKVVDGVQPMITDRFDLWLAGPWNSPAQMVDASKVLESAHD